MDAESDLFKYGIVDEHGLVDDPRKAEMLLKSHWIWIVGAAFFCLLSTCVQAQENPYEKNIYMWDGLDGRNLVMVPPSRLRNALLSVSGEQPETLGVPMKRWSLFVDQLAYSQQLSRKQCSTSTATELYGYPHPDHPGQRPAPGSRTALGPIHSQPTVIVGIVEAEIASWNFFSSVRTLVFFRIEEVLKDTSDSLAVGDLVTILLPWGDLELGPYSLCTYEPEGTLDFKLGDVFIVTGNMDEWNDFHIETNDAFYFKLVDGVVTYPPRRVSFKADPDLTLSRVRQELHGGEASHGDENP